MSAMSGLDLRMRSMGEAFDLLLAAAAAARWAGGDDSAGRLAAEVQRRAAIAGSLMADAAIMLMDEARQGASDERRV